jgi:hypothetical protein
MSPMDDLLQEVLMPHTYHVVLLFMAYAQITGSIR